MCLCVVNNDADGMVMSVDILAELVALRGELRALAMRVGPIGEPRIALTIEQMALRASVSRSQVYRWLGEGGTLAGVVWRIPSATGRRTDVRVWSDDFDRAMKGDL